MPARQHEKKEGPLGQQRWDLFCAVVDNYGDIGVCWRLARQLAQEHGLTVRLWVDHLPTFHRICPTLDADLDTQIQSGVEIRRWVQPFPDVPPAEVVIEAFACKLPDDYVAAMAALGQDGQRPVWINLEYLSAEAWVAGCHGLASPHPSLPLVKHFFFPGFVPGTGGLLRESALGEKRRTFQRDTAAQDEFWRGLGVPARPAQETRVSLFCYPNPATVGLFAAWAASPTPILCLVPEGVASVAITAFFGDAATYQRGNLKVRVLPFVEQAQYDHLLWACDCNFVRGEESFVRAQWAARPMVWHIYPQDDEVHHQKLQAFLDLYCPSLVSPANADLREFWLAWNHQQAGEPGWAAFWRHREAQQAHAEWWADDLLKSTDLAENLVKFCRGKL